MATLNQPFGFTGSLGGLSAYRMKGTDKIVLRRKSNAGRQRLLHDPNYAHTRLNNEEWKGCIAAGKDIRRAIQGLRHLADYNFSGPLHALCKNIQTTDREHDKGRRSVLLSAAGYTLEGFGLNTHNTFERLLRHPAGCGIDRSAGTAVVALPELLPGVNFFNPSHQPLYRLVCTLGAVSDWQYDVLRQGYTPVAGDLPWPVVVQTDWRHWKEPAAAATIGLRLPGWQDKPGCGLLLGVGIAFGVPQSNTEVQYVKYAGAAKLMKMA